MMKDGCPAGVNGPGGAGGGGGGTARLGVRRGAAGGSRGWG